MQSYEIILHNKQPMPNIRFVNSTKIGANLFFVPETEDGLVKFLNSQIKGYYGQITVPNIISNFLGKKLANQKYFLNLKKELPTFQYNRTPGKILNPEKATIFDFSGIINDIMSTAKSRSPKQVWDEFNKLITSVTKDYPIERDNILLVKGDSSIGMNSSDFLNFLLYINKLHGGIIETELDGIIYELDGKYFPLTSTVQDAKVKSLKFLRNMLDLVSKNKEDISSGTEKKVSIEDTSEVKDTSISDAKEKITKLSKNKADISNSMKEIKKIVHGITNIKGEKLVGTFEEKLAIVYKDDDKVHTELTTLSSDINKKYNGNIKVNIPHKAVFDMQKIVGMNELGSYNKQHEELINNMDDLIEDLVHGTLTSDPDLPITIKKISSKIVDNYKDRYKEYTVRIQHPGYGSTTDSPYNISFRIPIPVQEKYIKIGGNNFILINQLFPKPIQKVAPNLVRFYTHYSTASLSLKNTKLTAQNSFIDIEEKFVTQLKSIGAVSLENFDNTTKDNLVLKYGLSDLHDFKYSKMKIKA